MYFSGPNNYIISWHVINWFYFLIFSVTFDCTSRLRDDVDACLLESVKSYPVIYDISDANYKNNFRKSQAWLQVVEDMKKKGCECSGIFYFTGQILVRDFIEGASSY